MLDKDVRIDANEHPVSTAPAPDLLEIACDESGYEGDKLIDTTTDVFAHASVRLDTESATDCMRDLRDRIRSPATEYKATHLLREKHRSVLKWLLGPTGPLLGNTHVYLIDKALFAIGNVVDLLVEGVTHRARIGPRQDRRSEAMALTLYRDGPVVFGPERWKDFQVASNNLMRAKERHDASTSVESFFGTVDVLRRAGTRRPIHEILELLWRARSEADTFRARLLHDPTMIPAMDPLIPAIVQAVVHWSADTKPVFIAHDQQNTLSELRITQLKALLDGSVRGRIGGDSSGERLGGDSSRGRLVRLSSGARLVGDSSGARLVGASSGGRLVGFRFVDSESDSRIQVADILAGTARKIASDELNARGDVQLTTLLRPYLDASSIWGDERSRSMLGLGSGTRSD